MHGVNEHGVAKLHKTLPWAKVLECFAQLPPCLIGMEACAGAHYWARELARPGHTARLMAAQFVIPYRKRGKNDANDAEAICEAVGRPNMHFVVVKSPKPQAVLMVPRARTLVVANRTRPGEPDPRTPEGSQGGGEPAPAAAADPRGCRKRLAGPGVRDALRPL